MPTESDAAATEGEWVFHDGEGPFAGWLFRYTDGTLVTSDGTVLEEASPESAAPPAPVEPEAPVEDPAPVDAQVTEPAAEPVEETGPAAPATPPEEVREHAATAEAPVEATGPSPEGPTPPPPDFLRWSTSAIPQVLCGLVGLVAAVGAAILLVTSLGDGTDGLVTALGLGLLAAAGLYGLTALAPSTVTMRGAELSVDRGGEETTFDLADPQTSVEIAEPGDRRWRARLSSPTGAAAVLRSSQVDPADFTAACRAHLARRGD